MIGSASRMPASRMVQPRRPVSLSRDPSPGLDAERATVGIGRALVGAGAAAAAAAAGRASSREPRPLPPRAVGPEHRVQASTRAPASSMPHSQKLISKGPPLPGTRPRPVDGSYAAGKPSSSGDSLSELLHKPLLPQNGQLYERMADQLLESRNSRGRVSKSVGAKPLPTYEPQPLPNYDDEARNLWARLNLDPNKDDNGPYNSLDPIWRNPKTGGTIYVGNEVAAKSLNILEKHGISHVVNCTDSIPLYHERQPGAPITYLRFDITSHYHRARTDKEAVVFAQPMLDFVTDALSRGKNVMVHCLAGAHRAGTTGIICLMHFAKLGARDATSIAKQCRPIIDPICDFPLLLARLERGWLQQAHAG